MSEAKSYNLELSPFERVFQFIVGQLEWRELRSKEAFTIEQSKITKIHPSKSQDAVSVGFMHNDHKRIVSFKKSKCEALIAENPTLIENSVQKNRLKYFLESHVFVLPVFIVFYLPVLSLYLFSWGSSLFVSATCDNYCSNRISSVFIPFLAVGLFLMAPVFFHFFRKIVLSKTKRFFIPRAEVLMGICACLVALPLLYLPLSRPITYQVVKHWQQGTLNKQTIKNIYADIHQKSLDRAPSSKYFNNKKTE